MATLRYGERQSMEGWVRKEGKSIRFRKRRFLRFDGTMLSHYKKKEAPSPTWEVDITECRVSVGNRSLELVLTLDGSSMSFFAVNTDEYAAWLKALKSAVSKPDDYYTFGKTLGKGSYGEVFLGCDKVTNEMVAIKVIKRNPSSKRQVKFIERESSILKAVDHEHIVKTLDIFDRPDSLVIVTEFLEGGELFSRIIDEKCFTEQKARDIMRQILLGVQYLHSLGIVHRYAVFSAGWPRSIASVLGRCVGTLARWPGTDGGWWLIALAALFHVSSERVAYRGCTLFFSDPLWRAQGHQAREHSLQRRGVAL